MISLDMPRDPRARQNPLADPLIVALAARYGKTPAQIILRWHLQHGVSAIPKSVKPTRIAENFKVFGFALTPAEVAAIDALDTGVCGGPDPDVIDTRLYTKRFLAERLRGGIRRQCGQDEETTREKRARHQRHPVIVHRGGRPCSSARHASRRGGAGPEGRQDS